ncbi:MAG: fumarylacetoacetate hydrolase family protein [Acidobacteriota bacterium]|nr:fumarylacetoacetate hydrolase family protein [Acidobacteriota bacterium]
MRYCRYLSAQGPRYATVEMRDGAAWAISAMPPPEEDCAALRLEDRGSTHGFVPVMLEDLERQGKLLAPVTPSKIVCVGRNYRDHAAELGNEVPTEPLLFLKPPSSLLAPGATVQMPSISKRVDFEGELAVVIGRRCSKLSDGEDVRRYIRGYTCLNDVTARDIQKSDPQWTRGKGFDTFCPVGPVVTDDIDPIDGNVSLLTRVNGVPKQHGETRDFIFGIQHLLRYISACMTLEPGDVIATGTPAGVGALNAGDRVEVEIAGVGVLRSPVAAS